MNSVLLLFQITHDQVKVRMVGYQTLCCSLDVDDFVMPLALLSRDFIQLINQDFQSNHFELNLLIGKYICKLLLSTSIHLSKDLIEMVSC